MCLSLKQELKKNKKILEKNVFSMSWLLTNSFSWEQVLQFWSTAKLLTLDQNGPTRTPFSFFRLQITTWTDGIFFFFFLSVFLSLLPSFLSFSLSFFAYTLYNSSHYVTESNLDFFWTQWQILHYWFIKPSSPLPLHNWLSLFVLYVDWL